MGIILLSIDFKSAPVAIREQYAFQESMISDGLTALSKSCNVSEAVIVSTCNRTEIYVVSDELSEVNHILDWWQKQNLTGGAINDLSLYVKLLFNSEAVRHLMRTACGIESMVIGEPQILGQLKSAYAIARINNTLGTNLSQAFDAAFSVAKKVRSSTKLGACPVSVAFSAVSLAKTNFNDFSNKNILIIGAGNTAKLVGQHLKSCQPKSITIANRTIAKAVTLADSLNAQAIGLDLLDKVIHQADIIVAAVNNVRILDFSNKQLATDKDILLVDLSMPRSIKLEAPLPDNISLYSIDDIQQMLKNNERTRQHAAKIASNIIEDKLQAYIANKKVRKASNTIVAFRRHTEDIVQSEVQKSLRKLKNGADPEEVLTRFAYTLKNKILHKPTISLRQASAAGENEILGITEKLFNIES